MITPPSFAFFHPFTADLAKQVTSPSCSNLLRVQKVKDLFVCHGSDQMMTPSSSQKGSDCKISDPQNVKMRHVLSNLHYGTNGRLNLKMSHSRFL